MCICVYIYLWVGNPAADLLCHTLPVSVGYTLSLLLISLRCCILCVVQVPPLPIYCHFDEKNIVPLLQM